MSKQIKVRLSITKVYDFSLMAEDEVEARERCELVADRRLVQHKPKVEGEIDMKEQKGLEKWSWKTTEGN